MWNLALETFFGKFMSVCFFHDLLSIELTSTPVCAAAKGKHQAILDESLRANPVNGRRVANAVTLKSTFRLP